MSKTGFSVAIAATKHQETRIIGHFDRDYGQNVFEVFNLYENTFLSSWDQRITNNYLPQAHNECNQIVACFARTV
ncbi:MAG: hypothetical protein H0U72_13470 [Nitrosospira sp.]|nr:hypothetical protein [Nitrosospira sp.]